VLQVITTSHSVSVMATATPRSIRYHCIVYSSECEKTVFVALTAVVGHTSVLVIYTVSQKSIALNYALFVHVKLRIKRVDFIQFSAAFVYYQLTDRS